MPFCKVVEDLRRDREKEQSVLVWEERQVSKTAGRKQAKPSSCTQPYIQ